MASETTNIPTHPVISENGKKYYYLNIQPKEESSSKDPPKKVEEADVKTEQTPITRIEKSGPLHYYGENMVVKSAREMFNNVNILPDGRYFCCVCDRPYKTHATLTAHLRGSHLRQESPCTEPDCNHISYTENERRKHQKIHDKTKYSKFSRESLKIHQELDESVNRLRYPSENVLRQHTIHNNQQVPGMMNTVSRRGRPQYSCTQCNQRYQNVYSASRHMETHNHAPKQCFYCGEIRNGTMDLHVHYMRFHKNEGVRTITCRACQRGFTTTALFRNHANQKECELACRNLSIRQDIYYGELPDGTVVDQLTLNRMNFFRKRQEQRAAEEALQRQIDSETAAEEETSTQEMGGASDTVKDGDDDDDEEKEGTAAGSSSGCSSEKNDESDDIFVGSNSLIQTEFGLKHVEEFKTSRAPKRLRLNASSDDHYPFEMKRERVLMAQNGTYYHGHYEPPYFDGRRRTMMSSQQQNGVYQSDFIRPPPGYGYDPILGIYPDYQLQHYYRDPPNSYYAGSSSQEGSSSSSQIQDSGIQEETSVTSTSHQPQDPLGSSTDFASDLLVNQEQDVVFEELDKLDFVMPDDNQNDNDEDLEGMFNF